MYYPKIDLLRCFAVIGVLFSHFFNPNITKHLFTGTGGVDLFFVISGFLITEILFRYKESENRLSINLKKFYFRRILRIFPIYYLYIFIVLVLYKANVINQVGWAFCYIFNFYEMNYVASPLLIHIWSLSIEEQFYLIWPFLILFIPHKRILNVIVFIIFLSLFLKVLWPQINHKLFTISSFEAFGVGALFAYLKMYKPAQLYKYLSNKIPLYLGIGIYALIVLFSFTDIRVFDNWFRASTSVIAFYLLGIAVNTSNIKSTRLNTLLENKYLIYIGSISYGIYMYHILIAHLLDPFLDRFLLTLLKTSHKSFSYIYYNSYVLKFPINTLASILVATLSYRYIEKPFLLLKSKFFN